MIILSIHVVTKHTMNKSGRFDHFNDKCGTQAMIFFQNVHLFQHDWETGIVKLT